ncbi:MAG TPA: hypothetical protein VEC11_15130 [Allosphingosinicella sp.]|nr:hypothetical protein [Allosphingosinicella sp.]
MTSDEASFRRTAATFRGLIRLQLERLGRPVTDRRIKGIVWWDQDDEEPEPYFTVGEDLPNGAKGDPVLAILESARFADMYFVGTVGRFRAGEPPQAIALGKWWRVVEFDA